MKRCVSAWLFAVRVASNSRPGYGTTSALTRSWSACRRELMFLAENQLAAFGDQIEPVERYHILGDPLLRIDGGFKEQHIAR